MTQDFKWIVFSDLDGTLLDARNYSFAGAEPGLELLRRRKIPLVLCTSKTFKEVLAIQQRLAVVAPFITENGSAVYLPKESFAQPLPKSESYEAFHVLVLGKTYPEILAFFAELKTRFHLKVKGFSEMALPEISRVTGLPVSRAALAKERLFSEPFIALEPISDFSSLENFARQQGFRLLRGNRFYHLLGDTDKGRALKETVAAYRRGGLSKIKCLGLGDSPNDIELFLQADQPVLIKKPGGGYADVGNIKNLFYTAEAGPRGWSEALLHFL